MKNKGFTLIDLLVVVAIIGILAAVGIVAYSGYTLSAKRNATLSQHSKAVKFIQNTLALCEVSNESKEDTMKFLEIFDEDEDVQNVYTNFKF